MTSPDTRSQQINHLRVRIANLEQQLDEARLELKVLETLKAQQSPATEEIDPDEQPPRQARITHASTSDEKLQLFRSRFRGREDAFAHSWVNQRKGTKGWAPRTRTWVAPKDVTASDLLPLTDKVVYEHLSATAPGSAHFHLGLYPLLPDDHCYLLACDFDKGTWKLDAQAYAWAATTGSFLPRTPCR